MSHFYTFCCGYGLKLLLLNVIKSRLLHPYAALRKQKKPFFSEVNNTSHSVLFTNNFASQEMLRLDVSKGCILTRNASLNVDNFEKKSFNFARATVVHAFT